MPATVGGYQLLQRLAVGGMAEVFLARRPGPAGFTKLVALKRILPHLAQQPDFVTMFLDEARHLASLSHVHVVSTFDFGSDGDAYFMAMEYVAGEDVQSLLRAAHAARERLSLVDAVTILVAAAEALHHAHEHGIVHRDVTPANLLVGYDGIVKLADFGIAKSLAGRARTTAGTLKGKVPYMSPEQARAQPLDRRSDIFSLGVVAWELLAGRRLFAHKHEIELLHVVQQCQIPSLLSIRPDVPPALAVAVETALAPAPNERWASAAEFARALTAALTAAGAAPSAESLRATLARYFGADAAKKKRAAAHVPVETTDVMPLPEPAATPPTRARRSSERWIPHIAMHLHVPPPRARVLVPLLALFISAVGLVFGLRSPRAVPVPVAAAVVRPPPIAPPHVESHDHAREKPHRTARAKPRR